MDRQELVENILRLYVFLLDETAKNQQSFEKATEHTFKVQHAGRIHSLNQVKAFIEDHFRPLV